MRITEAARRLGTSPRMLRYRDLLGLLPPVRVPPSARPHASGRPPAHAPGRAHASVRGPAPGGGRGHAAGHRQFDEDDLLAVSLALGIEQRYDISPAALAFGLRVLTEPAVRAEVADLGRRIGRIRPLPARALEFEKERALRLLSLAPSRPAARVGQRTRPARPPGQRDAGPAERAGGLSGSER
jgi:hypothetical protein